MARVHRGCEESSFYFKPQIPLENLPISWRGDILAPEIFGFLPSARSRAIYFLVCIDHFCRWVELSAAFLMREEEAIPLLGDVFTPHHGMPSVVLSENGPQLIAEVLCNLW